MKSKNLRMLLSTAIAAILLVSFSCSSQRGAAKEEGFVNLFNGKNFDGWDLQLRESNPEMVKKVFTVENGIIHIFKDLPEGMGSVTNINATHGMMWTKKKYSKYIFKFDYKWGKKLLNNYKDFQYDAGCFFHLQEKNIWPKGIEYQVRYDNIKNENHTGDFWASQGYLFQWTMGKDGRFALPSNGGVEIPKRGKEHLAVADANYNGLNDKWNTCEIIVMDNKYTIHKLNGKVVNYATDMSTSDGYIGLQAETGEIYYRNIMLKEFKEEHPASEFLK